LISPDWIHTTFVRDGQLVPRTSEQYLPRMVPDGDGGRMPGDTILVAGPYAAEAQITTVDVAAGLGRVISRHTINTIDCPLTSVGEDELALMAEFADHPGNHIASSATRRILGTLDETQFFLQQAPVPER
jgi:hypothetical protein